MAKNVGGRPLKFKSPKALKDAITAYFMSCWEPVMEQRLKDASFDAQKHLPEKVRRFKDTDYEWVPVLDWQGKPVLRQVRPYSITGLALALKTSRQLLIDYQSRAGFLDAVKEAKLKCENFVEEGMLTGKVHPVSGIFNLKNNYGWVDESKLDLDASDTLAGIIAAAAKSPTHDSRNRKRAKGAAKVSG